MTVEHLHDALTLLPADLVAEADQHRGKKRPAILWQRYAAMAACFALLVCAGSFCMRMFGPMGRAKSEAPTEAMAQMAADTAVNEEAAVPGELCPGEGIPETVAETARDSGAEAELPASLDHSAAKSTAGSLEEPPILTVLSGENAIDVSSSSYSWEVPLEDGLANSVIACGPAPVDHPENLPPLEAESQEITLHWGISPDDVTLRYWSSGESGWEEGVLDGEAPSEMEAGDYVLRLPQGAELFEVTAQWPQGSASYSFRLE